MRSLLSLALGAVLLLTAGAASALAAKPDKEHISETGDFEIPDYCGTGVTLEIGFTSVRNYWFGDDSEKLTYQTKYTLTAATSDNATA